MLMKRVNGHNSKCNYNVILNVIIIGEIFEVKWYENAYVWAGG